MVILAYVDEFFPDDGSEIKISGQYLRELGFEPGSRVVIDVTTKAEVLVIPLFFVCNQK